MAAKTKIGWADGTWSPWRGCVHVSEGCANCYADAGSGRNPAVLGTWGDEAHGGQRILNANWQAPRTWAKKAAAKKPAADGRRLVLFPSLCDPFEDWRGPITDHASGKPAQVWDRELMPATMDFLRREFWKLIEDTKAGAVWTLLTKRPENAFKMAGSSAPSAWLLASVENQKWHDRRAWHLAAAAHLFAGTGLSIEPQLGPIRLKSICVKCETYNWDLAEHCANCYGRTWRPDWVIIGGESGARGKVRPFFVQWGLDLVAQCRNAGIPVFFKQLGSFPLFEVDPREDPNQRDGVTAWAIHKSRGELHKRTGLWEIPTALKPTAKVVRWPNGRDPRPGDRVALELALEHSKGEDSAEFPNALAFRQFPPKLKGGP